MRAIVICGGCELESFVIEKQLRILNKSIINDVLYVLEYPLQEEILRNCSKEYPGLQIEWMYREREEGFFNFSEMEHPFFKEEEEYIVIKGDHIICQSILSRLINGSTASAFVCKEFSDEIEASEVITVDAKNKIIPAMENTPDDELYSLMGMYKTKTFPAALNGSDIVLLRETEVCYSKNSVIFTKNADLIGDVDFLENLYVSKVLEKSPVIKFLDEEMLSRPFVLVADENKEKLMAGFLGCYGYACETCNISDVNEKQRILLKCDCIIAIGDSTVLKRTEILKNEFEKYAGSSIKYLYIPDQFYEIEAPYKISPEYIVIHPALLAAEDREKKIDTLLQGVFVCGMAICSPRINKNHLIYAKNTLNIILDNFWGSVEGNLANIANVSGALHAVNILRKYSVNNLGCCISERLATEQGISLGHAQALCIPCFWRFYITNLIYEYPAVGRKAVAGNMEMLRVCFGVTSNSELVELFAFLMKQLGLGGCDSSLDIQNWMKGLAERQFEDDPFDITEEQYEGICEEIKFPKTRFIYNQNDMFAKGSWVAFIKFWKAQLTELELIERRAIENEILDDLVRVCAEKGWKYYLGYETLLGAAYYHGFVPWGDTIDVHLMRDDYEELGEEIPEWFEEKYFLHWDRSDEYCWFRNLRIMKRGSYVDVGKEHYIDTPYKGVYISVWPIDRTISEHGLCTKLRYKAVRGLEALIQCRLIPGYRKLGWKGKLCLKFLAPISVRKLKAFQESCLRGKGKGDYYSIGQRYSFGQEIFPEDMWGNPAETLVFNGMEYFVPGQWERVLDKLYRGMVLDDSICSRRPPTPWRIMSADNCALISLRAGAAKNNKAEKKVQTSFVKKKIVNIRKFIKKNLGPAKRLFERTYTRISGRLRSRGFLWSENSKELASYRDKYRGKRCFLIANGPSLVAEDLDKLVGEVTFACNFICKIYDQTKWRPTFYCVSDSGVVRTNSQIIVDNLKDSLLLIREFAYRYMSITPRKALKLPYISVDWYRVHGNILEYHYISHATILSMMLEIAFYMGFSEIYIIGMDGTSSTSSGGHFVNNYYSKSEKEALRKRIAQADPMRSRKDRARHFQQRSLDIFEMLNTYAKNHNIKIYNATRGGIVEVFERRVLDEVLAEE